MVWFSCRRFFATITIFMVCCAARTHAAVGVLANYSKNTVNFDVVDAAGHEKPYSLAHKDVIPIDANRQTSIAYASGDKRQCFLLQPNSINCFIELDKTLVLRSVILPKPKDESGNLPAPKARMLKNPKPVVISVKILADDDEPAVQKIWEKKFRRRIAKASNIFERACGVRFEVKAVEMWKSDNKLTNFEDSMREFERKVNPAPCRVAIGFTSQYALRHGLTHMGGTRGALNSHVLIREWSQHVSPSERLEILVHELGHFLGASHSGDPDSVMRPKLGDHRSNAVSFRIGFDPLNTLAMNIVADELRSGEFKGFFLMPLDARRQLQRIYLALENGIPEDPASRQYIGMLHLRTRLADPSPQKPPELVVATQDVVQAVVSAAKVNRTAFIRLKGDSMTEYYIGRAAAAAIKHPSPVARRAFLLGIGIALNDEKLWPSASKISALQEKIENPDARDSRLSVLGKITMRGRSDLARHFALSCALTVELGPSLAEKASLAKEIYDAHGGSGFSFVDLMADMAGVSFAKKICEGKIPLQKVAKNFNIPDFLPDYSELEEGLSWDEFTEKYKSVNNKNYLEVRAKIQERIDSMPGFVN
ncbi:MAG: M12 family metallo-peptidase [Thermoguttaceae bacterium]